VPQPVCVPVPVTPEPPAVQPVQVALLTLRPGAAPADVRVKRDIVVTRINAGDRERSLVVDPIRLPGIGAGAGGQRGATRPNGSFSLVFHQHGQDPRPVDLLSVPPARCGQCGAGG